MSFDPSENVPAQDLAEARVFYLEDLLGRAHRILGGTVDENGDVHIAKNYVSRASELCGELARAAHGTQLNLYHTQIRDLRRQLAEEAEKNRSLRPVAAAALLYILHDRRSEQAANSLAMDDPMRIAFAQEAQRSKAVLCNFLPPEDEEATKETIPATPAKYL